MKIALLSKKFTCVCNFKCNFGVFFFIHDLKQVRSEGEMQDVFNRAREKFGRVDILVNCAGYSTAFLTVTSVGTLFNLETYKRLLEVHIQ